MAAHHVFTIAVMALLADASFATCQRAEPRSGTADASGVRKLVIHGRAGDLVVVGRADASEVQVDGEACAKRAKTLAAVQLDVRKEGDTVHIVALIPDEASYYGTASLSMEITAPATADVHIRDSGGDVKVTGMAALTIADRSGDIVIRDIGGDVRIEDRSGDIDVGGVRGNLEVHDSSGDVKIEDVAGSVEIPVDSSGTLRIRRVRGDVHVRADSSGDIVITDVNRNVVIGYDSTGDIRVADIGGDFTVERGGSGRISQRNVLGAVRIAKASDDSDH